MNNYLIIIKSHCDYPDFESEIEAKNRKKAIEYFYRQLRGEFDREYINSQIGRIYKSGRIA